MKINYNYAKIIKTLNNLSKLINIPISFVPIALQNSTEYPPTHSLTQFSTPTISAFCKYIQKDLNIHQKCLTCDLLILNSKEFKSHICHSGLFDATFPVVKNDITVGHLLFGCLRCLNSPDEPYGITDKEAVRLYKERPFFTDEQIDALKNLLPDILFGDAISIEYSDILDEICAYIKDNLYKELTIKSLCSVFYISKNTLYKLFDEHLDTTPNDYIVSLRLDKAKELLSDKTNPIYLIASSLGFESYPHFCRIFKKKTGLSPSQYRNSFSKTT